MANFETQKQHVKRTWAMAKDASDVAGLMFYRRLFETTPEVMGLFQADTDVYLKRQAKRLFRMITAAVDLLDNPVELFSMLEEAGGAHVGYGVKYEHYDKTGAALLWTLENALGKDVFTDEVKASWVTVWTMIRASMLAGASSVYETQLAEAQAEIAGKEPSSTARLESKTAKFPFQMGFVVVSTLVFSFVLSKFLSGSTS